MSKDVDFYKRLLWYKKRLFSSADPKDDGISPVPATEDKANLVSSLTDKGMHMPVIDIDYSAELLPSSTPGHFHLYLNKAVPWSDYKKVLLALYEAHLIQKGYYDWSIERGMSMLRRPGVKKNDSNDEQKATDGERSA
jgi:hypothetical protein